MHTIDELSGDGTVRLSGAELVVGNAGGSSTFSGAVEEGNYTVATGGSLPSSPLTKTGAGTITLSGNNTYRGQTNVNQGVLKIAQDNALGTADAGTVVANGAALHLQGGITVAGESLQTTGAGISGSGVLRSLAGDNAIGGSVTLNNGSIGVDPGSTLTINGPMTSTGIWRKVGGGKLVLTGANTQNTNMDVNGGTLNLQNSAALGGGSYAHVYQNNTLEVEGGVNIPQGLYVGNINQTDPAVSLRSVAGDNTWSGYVRLHSGHQHARVGVDAGSTLTISGPIETYNGSVGSLTKVGPGLLTVTGTSNTYVGPTFVDEGTLRVDGSITSSPSVTVAAGATLEGTGWVPTVDGAGAVSPGASPGILTAPSVNPAGGLDFAFELLTAGSPDYNSAGSSVNDVLRLTDATAPLAAPLDGSNRVDVYLGVTDLVLGDRFRGGFYTDRASDFSGLVSGAAFNFYILGDGGGSHPFGGQTYYTLAEFGPITTLDVTTVAETADFASGDVAGFVMQLAAVPEPTTAVLFLLGALTLAWRPLRRRRRFA